VVTEAGTGRDARFDTLRDQENEPLQPKNEGAERCVWWDSAAVGTALWGVALSWMGGQQRASGEWAPDGREASDRLGTVRVKEFQMLVRSR
jgi:hypothetical protein